jgi:cytoskeletal protein CcmA (bactofilin family)
MGQLNAFIDQGSEFSGQLRFSDTVRIDGKFDGEISSDNTLIIGESGRIRATINSEMVIISGEVEGDIVAPSQVVIHKMARVTGDIKTASLAVEEGAQINGQITMTGTVETAREGRDSKRGESGATKGSKGDTPEAKKSNGQDPETSDLEASPPSSES